MSVRIGEEREKAKKRTARFEVDVKVMKFQREVVKEDIVVRVDE